MATNHESRSPTCGLVCCPYQSNFWLFQSNISWGSTTSLPSSSFFGYFFNRSSVLSTQLSLPLHSSSYPSSIYPEKNQILKFWNYQVNIFKLSFESKSVFLFPLSKQGKHKIIFSLNPTWRKTKKWHWPRWGSQLRSLALPLR